MIGSLLDEAFERHKVCNACSGALTVVDEDRAGQTLQTAASTDVEAAA